MFPTAPMPCFSSEQGITTKCIIIDINEDECLLRVFHYVDATRPLES